jgi:hypothetical protein
MNKFLHKPMLALALFLLVAAKTEAERFYVNASATGNNDGTSWADAFDDLQSALPIAGYGDEVWVAQGTYRPTPLLNRMAYFEVKNGAKVYGGFAGNETELGQRDWNLYPTILSGDIGTETEDHDNSYTVVYIVNADSTTLLDGFTIQDGNANSNAPGEPVEGRTKSGGGLYVNGTNAALATRPAIRNCSFLANKAVQQGGAVMVLNNAGFVVSPNFSYCSFVLNSSGSFGGAVYCTNWSETNSDTLLFDHCEFTGNEAIGGGAFFYAGFTNAHALHLANCVFLANFAKGVGGAISYYPQSQQHKDFLLDSCQFLSNSNDIDGGGGAIFASSGWETVRMVINNSVFDDNFSGRTGAILVNGIDIEVNNTRFTKNASVKAAGCVELYSSRHAEFNNCLFESSLSLERSSVFEMIGSPMDFRVTNCSFVGNDGPRGMIDVYDSFGLSARFSNNIFSGNGLSMEGKLIDLFGFIDSVDFNFSNCLLDVPSCEELANLPVATCGGGMQFGADPHFVDAPNHDYRLQACSSARNAGSNAVVDSLEINIDLDGNPRVQGGAVDLGCYEVNSNVSMAAPNAVCSGELGEVSVDLQNWCPPYSATWVNSNGEANSLSTDTAAFMLQLVPDTYSFTISDNIGDTLTTVIVISELQAITATDTIQHASSPTALDGSITLTTVSGGSGGYTFLWSNGDTMQSISGLATGTYTVTVTDAAGCSADFAYFIDVMSSVGATSDNLFGALIVPNPSRKSDKAAVVFKRPHLGVALKVYDEQGRLVHEASPIAFASRLIQLPNGLLPATYRVVLETGNTRVALVWVVQ